MQEFSGGGIQDRPARSISPADILDQAFKQQILHHPVAVDPADAVDVRAGDRLFVGDDSQCFQRGLAEMAGEFQAEESLDQIGHFRSGRQLNPTGVALETQPPVLEIER